MRKKVSALLGLCVALFLLASLSACGHEQQLVSITIVPNVETFGGADIPLIANKGAQVQLRALGSYIHPPVTKDITTQVVWSSNTPDMVTVDAAGLITATGTACGGTIISATVTTNRSTGDISSKGAIITGTMQANVTCFTGQ
jgi:Bacterial Ig-like domain (group 2)